MDFKYEEETKDHYKHDDVALKYHNAFASDTNIASLRFRFVAWRERTTVKNLMRRVQFADILDLPAGTGKLAPTLSSFNRPVMACDISPQMLEIAKSEYEKVTSEVEFRVCDATSITSTLNRKFSLLVSLRLMHRVPRNVRQAMLREFAECADTSIVSFGIETNFHRWRRKVRAAVLGVPDEALCFDSHKNIRAELAEFFEVIDSKSIAPFLSQEVIFLLRPL